MSAPNSPAFERFFEFVVKDPALLERLRAARDAGALATLAVELGRERGFEFAPEEVAARMQATRRAWHERRLA